MLNSTIMKNKYRWIFLFASIMCVSAIAQDNNTSGVTSDFLNVYNYTTGKTVQLAAVIPQEKYNWSPAESVRSVKEVVLHVAGGNYMFASMLGGTIPEGIDPRELEKSEMNREEAIAVLNSSITFVQETVKKLSADDLNAQIDFFGNKATKRQVMFTLGDHAAEHLGQLIAYARSNGIAPPWSQKSN